MDLTHAHLLLNHIPTIGFAIALVLLLWAVAANSRDLQQASLTLLVVIGLFSIPAYVSGNAAQETLANDPGVSQSLVRTHEGAALESLIFIEITAAFAWLGLWQSRHLTKPQRWTMLVVVIFGLVALALVARAANIGGEIRHPEIRAEAETTTAEGHFARTVGSFVLREPWGWPSLETLHFMGLTILMGVVLLIDLRMLGILRNVSFPSLHRMFPWAILGFGLNVLTGTLFFVATPDQYDQNPAFVWKLAFVMVAGLNALYFTLFDGVWKIGPNDDAPISAKLAAVSAIVLWMGVLYFGSMLPFIGDAF